MSEDTTDEDNLLIYNKHRIDDVHQLLKEQWLKYYGRKPYVFTAHQVRKYLKRRYLWRNSPNKRMRYAVSSARKRVCFVFTAKPVHRGRKRRVSRHVAYYQSSPCKLHRAEGPVLPGYEQSSYLNSLLMWTGNLWGTVISGLTTMARPYLP